MTENLNKSLDEEFDMAVSYRLTKTLVDLRQTSAAEKVAGRALEKSDKHPKSVAAQAEILLEKGRRMEAFRILKRSLRANPNDCDLLVEFAKTNWRLGNYDNVKSNSKYVRKMCPDIPDAHLYLGYVSYKISDKGDAKKHFKNYLKLGGNEKLLPSGY